MAGGIGLAAAAGLGQRTGVKHLPLLLLSALAPLTASAGTISPTKAEVKRFEKVDTSNDELISLAEFTAQMKVLAKARSGGPGNVVELEEVAAVFFNWFDTDNDNSVDLFEWVVARTSNPNDAGLPNVRALAGIDLNADEFVKVSEFVKVLKEILPAKFAVAWFKTLSE